MGEYLTFDDYLNYSLANPQIDKLLFDKLIYKAESKFDYFTNNRLNNIEYEKIPREIKRTITEFINAINDFSSGGTKPIQQELSSYSNGIESFGYFNNSNSRFTIKEQELNALLWQILEENCSKYPNLIYRGELSPNANVLEKIKG